MSDTGSDKPGEGPGDGPGIVRRQIQPSSETSEYDFLEIVAEIEGCEIEELPSLYNEVEHVIETLFKTPPSTAAQMSISFSYSGYRVTIDRNGVVTLVPVAAR
ncbi:HalOD1 output domain-containing protein [Haloarcula laminariae]|uniref:HalOD1 output domain-containing protein n=1 Tax=Haloarcula laminariae TaxID=2961577 RepID=UPI002406B1D1|nr:HalOD1 output domain-containing protein [Halomicroarcula sp. FL173]